MEIALTFVHNLTLSEMMVALGVVAVGIFAYLYGTIIAPKIRHRKVLERVRQKQYEKESRKRALESTFTWGEFTRSEFGAAYEVKEYADTTDLRFGNDDV